MNQKVLLDTHVWMWLINGDSFLRTSPSYKVIIEAKKHNAVLISPISVWEIGMLESKERITLGMEVHQWVENAFHAPGTSLLPLDLEIMLESTRLPGGFQSDPADCMLIASARKADAILITRDKTILEYGEKKFVKILRA